MVEQSAVSVGSTIEQISSETGAKRSVRAHPPTIPAESAAASDPVHRPCEMVGVRRLTGLKDATVQPPFSRFASAAGSRNEKPPRTASRSRPPAGRCDCRRDCAKTRRSRATTTKEVERLSIRSVVLRVVPRKIPDRSARTHPCRFYHEAGVLHTRAPDRCWKPPPPEMMTSASAGCRHTHQRQRPRKNRQRQGTHMPAIMI